MSQSNDFLTTANQAITFSRKSYGPGLSGWDTRESDFKALIFWCLEADWVLPNFGELFARCTFLQDMRCCSLALACMNNGSRRLVGGRVRDGMAGDVSSEIEARNRGGWRKGGSLCLLGLLDKQND